MEQAAKYSVAVSAGWTKKYFTITEELFVPSLLAMQVHPPPPPPLDTGGALSLQKYFTHILINTANYPELNNNKVGITKHLGLEQQFLQSYSGRR